MRTQLFQTFKEPQNVGKIFTPNIVLEDTIEAAMMASTTVKTISKKSLMSKMKESRLLLCAPVFFRTVAPSLRYDLLDECIGRLLTNFHVSATLIKKVLIYFQILKKGHFCNFLLRHC